jgi:hypothetical protein
VKYKPHGPLIITPSSFVGARKWYKHLVNLPKNDAHNAAITVSYWSDELRICAAFPAALLIMMGQAEPD